MEQPSEPKLSKYFNSKGVRLGLPVTGGFELTGRCNFNCKMCYVHTCKVTEKEELTADEWLKIAEDAKKQGLLFLLLTGGEPLVRKDFPYIYKNLAKMGFVLSVNSNGSLMDDSVIKLFEEYPPCRVNISLYGASDDTYNSLCGNRSFEKSLESIKTIKKMGVCDCINLVVNKYNKDDTEKIFAIGKELNITIRSTAYVYPSVRTGADSGESEARLSPEEAADYMFLMKRLKRTPEEMKKSCEEMFRLNNDECDYEPQKDGEPLRCRAGRSSFWITYDGKMLPCGMMKEPYESVKELGFAEAWKRTHERAAKIRTPSECANCKDSKRCSVCAAICYAETGSFEKRPEYICRMEKRLYTLTERELNSNGSDKYIKT